MLTEVIPSYLYTQYADDDNLQSFVAAFNGIAQQYVDWFNTASLPVYTGLSGSLLDWVAQGLYGIGRPYLPSGTSAEVGPYNTETLNSYVFNAFVQAAPLTYYATNDDIFKRIITWNFYKGDGQVFNIRWLKRRIMRFLTGVNGTDPGVNQTYQVSVSFGPGNQVNINILNGARMVTGGALYNSLGFNKFPYNDLESNFVNFTPLTAAPMLQAGIQTGVLQLPFQFTYVVSIE